ncbi:hypothetical protein [Microbispora triticiradicis]|uniref:hypothetical protein n=1 Tax=Microbispora triticiradicis TaxID=2200763 RepID=UPI001AD732DF|nr:hypothetical protein [Microbispora triticiradicis]MBO4275714.1 hypothetical protein [Microbispora triticiradicis]
MTEHPGHVDHIAICSCCQGLTVTRMERFGEVASSSLTFGDGSTLALSGGTLYVGPPLDGPDCPR